MDKKLAEKSILVIGANGGLASETIKHLINDGYKKIVMGCRSEVKGIKAREWILANAKNTEGVQLPVVGGFDMNDPKKIKTAIEALPSNQVFDIVFLAAGGAVFTDDFQTVEWNGKRIEKNVFQNMMGSHVALSYLRQEDLLTPKARIVLSGGEGARGIPGLIESPTFSSSKELRDYIFVNLNGKLKYNPMNALGTSKFFGALWTLKMAELEASELEVVWFTPGLTYGTEGLQGLPPIKQWFMKNIMFGIMKLIGQAQSPSDGGRKFADCIGGKIGGNGDLIGAPEGKSIGKLTDQKPMNAGFGKKELQEEFWTILEEAFGVYAA